MHSVQITHHLFVQTFKKSVHEEILPRESIFQKTHIPLIKKLQITEKAFTIDSTEKREKNHFSKLNTSFVLDNKLFRKTVRLFFSNKGSNRANVKLAAGDKLS